MVDIVDTPTSEEDGEITRVELHSIGGLCEPDLTGSSHVLIITYRTGEKIAKIVDAGAFQKKSEQIRNTIFEEIYQKYKVSGIVLTHNHFDHCGRIVATHKAVREHHNIPDLPIYTSRPSRRILPHVLQSYHGLQKNNTRSFDEACGRFWQAFNEFSHNYATKPKKEVPSRKDHRPHGDKMIDARAKREKAIQDLEDEFFAEGGERNSKGELFVPKKITNKKFLNNIIKAIGELKTSELSKYSSAELYKINKTRQALAYLSLGENVNDFFEEIFSVEIPRSDRKGRQKQIDDSRKYIEEKIQLHRKTLLPEITPEDIDHVLQNAHGVEERKSYNLPGLPGVKISFHPNGHMLGSVGVKFIFNMVGNQVRSLLLSGDIGRFRENSLHGDPEIQDADIGVVETTYANKKHPEKGPEIETLVNFIQEKSGPILMPVFSLDRMYVVLHELREQILGGEIDCPIYCRNILGENTCESYLNKYPELKPVVDKIKFIGGEDAHKIMRTDEKCIMLASGGTLQDTSSANNLLNTSLGNRTEPTIVLTGYQPAGIGKILMEFCRGTEDPKATVTVYLNDGTPCEIERKNILLTGIFSGHGDHQDLCEYVSQIRKRILWIHGDPKGANAIQGEFPNSEIVERDKTILLFDSQTN